MTNQTKLFHLTRWRLASWYAVVMGLILSLCGFGAYNAIAHAHWITLNRELESVAGTLHDSLEPTLKQPGRIESETQYILPNICLIGKNCLAQIEDSKRHILGAIHQGNYYVRLFDKSGRFIAQAGTVPEKLPVTLTKEPWQIIKDSNGIRYRHITLMLHTQTNTDWGYMQLGRSIKDFDDYLAATKWILGLGLPIAMGLVGISSWYLAGLAMQPIRHSYQLLQQFTADAAHELRTPLAALQATIESTPLTQQLSEFEARERQQTIERQVHRLSQLVRDLLLLCRMDRQALPTQRVSCSLNEIIGDLVEEFEELALAADVKLTTEVRTHQPIYITGDPEQLYRLISNLIVNGIQYTPAGGRVTIILGRTSVDALIQIQDTGIGIALKDQKRIFDRFYRVNSDRSRNTGGSGLGLAIAQAIVQSHGGSLTVHSQLGKGSTFTVRLPLELMALKG
jgi:signal transduction histidine kinase